MDSILINLFLSISKLTHLQNPLLVMTEEETIPAHFCSGFSFPLICTHYGVESIAHLANKLQFQNRATKKHSPVSPVFLSNRNHSRLMKEMQSNLLAFTKSQVWVMPLEYVSMLPLRLDSNIFFYERTTTGFIVYEGYAINGGNPITSELFGWPEVEPKRIGPLNLLVRRTLKGAILKVAWHGSTKAFVGRNVDILKDLQSKLNFVAQIVPAKDRSWGSKSNNGTWNGLVGMLNEKLIDMTLGGTDTTMMVTEERQSVVDYLWSFEQITSTLLTAQPSKPKLDAWGYIDIFPGGTWLLIGSFLILGAFCFSLSSHEAIHQGTALMLRLYLQMPYGITTNIVSSKILMLVAALCLKMIFIYYTSSLKAIMTSETRQINIKSLSDAEKQGYKVLTLPHGNYAYDIFVKAPKDSIFRRLHENKVHEVVPLGENDGHGGALKRLNEDPKALYYAYQRKSFERMGIVALDINEEVPVFKAIALQKDSEFFTIFNYHIRSMIESGKIKRLILKWAGKYDNMYGMEEAVQLGGEHVLLPFIAFALGIVIAILLMLTELLVWRSLPRSASTREIHNISISENNIEQVLYDNEKRIENLVKEKAALEAKVKALMMERINEM